MTWPIKNWRVMSVWPAGSTGFVGSVVLEQLMRLCPTFKRIYLLIRVKRGQQGKRGEPV